MIQFTLLFSSILGALAVVLGAFGAHALKKILSEAQLKSFETGVKYQMYHSIVLLIIGFNFNLETSIEKYMVYSFIWIKFHIKLMLHLFVMFPLVMKTNYYSCLENLLTSVLESLM